MNCRELIEEFIADYFDGTLAAEERAEFERHLAICSSCRAYLASYETALRAAKAAAALEDPMPDELVDAILKARPQ